MITKKEMKILLKSQQGELDGAAMYSTLARTVKEQSDKKTFMQLAKEEGHHAAVFHKLTGKTLKAKKWKGRALSTLYKILGKKRLYSLIAKGEYAAVKTYRPVVERFPEVKSVQMDEKRHGDTVMGLLQ